MPNVSLYVRDDLLAELDKRVEEAAEADRAEGRTGRAVTSRSKLMEQYLEDGLAAPQAADPRFEPFDISKIYGTMVFDDRDTMPPEAPMLPDDPMPPVTASLAVSTAFSMVSAALVMA